MEKGEGIKGEEREKGGWEKGELDTLSTLQTCPNMA